MKNLKSVKVVKNAIDEMYTAMTLVDKDDIDVILRVNPAIKGDLDQLKELLRTEDAEISPIIEPVVKKEETKEEPQAEEVNISMPEPPKEEPKITLSLSSDWLKYKPDAIWK